MSESRREGVCEGVAAELEGIDLGDKRLNKRSVTLIEALAADPQASINAACEGWSDTLEAYRLLDNKGVDPHQLMKPHLDATRQRMNEHPVVLVVQDTTELDFTSYPPGDARCLNQENRFGLYDHTHLAVTPEKLCLGLVGTEQFDRAANIYDIFMAAEQHSTPADFIIRAKEDRCTPERNPDSGLAVYRKVREEVSASALRTMRTITLPQTSKRKARQAELEIRAIPVKVKPPHARSDLPSVTYQVVLVEEVKGPCDGTDVSWLLITSLPIDSVEAILLVIDYYVARWIIEVYFRVFKTGCKVEEIQLETLSRVKNCLAFCKIIAWRVMYLTYLNRECPEVPCTALFTASQWKSVWRVTTKQAHPRLPPHWASLCPC